METPKQHFKLIVLIIANNGVHGEYFPFQEVWQNYMNKFENIKSFFIFGKGQEVKYPENSIVTNHEENLIPGVLDKTLSAMEYVNNNFTYDFLLRTNLSSFYRLDLLLTKLQGKKNNFVFAITGYSDKIPFPSGAGFVLSPDVVDLILQNKDDIDKSIIDDVAIGRLLFQHKIQIIQATRYDIIVKKNMENISADLEKREYYHFRLKTDDRTYDANVAMYLYDKYYLNPVKITNQLQQLNLNENQIAPSKDAPKISKIRDTFLKKCQTVSDIYEHLPMLYEYSKKCETIVEFGVRTPTSSYAFAQGLLDNNSVNKRLIGVDLNYNDEIVTFKKECESEGIKYSFFKGNDLHVNIEPCDMLFIDSWHVYGQLIRELETHCMKVKKWIILHDTEVDKITGETLRCGWDIFAQMKDTGFSYAEIYLGLYPALQHFLYYHKEFVMEKSLSNCNGLTVLRRI